MTQGTYCIKDLERELRELRQANDIVKKGLFAFYSGGARPPKPYMIGIIDAHHKINGVPPLCRVL